MGCGGRVAAASRVALGVAGKSKRAPDDGRHGDHDGNRRAKGLSGGGQTHSIKAWRASWPILSISSLLLRGLMVLASPSSYSSSLSSTWGLSRGIMMVPLDLRLPRRGRDSFEGSSSTWRAWSCSLTDELDEVELMSSG